MSLESHTCFSASTRVRSTHTIRVLAADKNFDRPGFSSNARCAKAMGKIRIHTYCMKNGTPTARAQPPCRSRPPRGARTRGCRRPAARPCRRRRRRRRRATVLESLRVPVPPPRARKPLADNCVASAHEASALLRGLDHHRGTDGRDRVGIDPSAIALEVLDDLREAELHSICLHASSVSALAGTLEHSERLTIGQNGGM